MKSKKELETILNYLINTKHAEVRRQYPGDKVQIDIKYVPKESLKFDTRNTKYYQITAIDEYSRKRVLEIVNEKSVTYD